MINVVILVGRLTKDSELQMTGSGKKLCRFTLACNKPQGCDFVPCNAWEKTADILATYGKKGRQIGVEGRISVDKNREGKTYISVTANRVALLGSKEENEAPGRTDPVGWNETPQGGFPIESEDLPF
jgi:single-strand DNA-binding protein